MATTEETEYVCALSGVAADDEALVVDAADDDDLEELPVGWTRVTLDRRMKNPRYEMIQQVMAGVIEQTLAQVPEANRDAARPLLALQVEAQYAVLLDRTPPYLTETEVTFIAPPDSDTALKAAYTGLRTTLGLSVDATDKEEKE